MAYYRQLLAVLLVCAAVLSWWLLQHNPPDDPSALSGAQRTVDYYVVGLDVTRMTPAGVPAHRLRAQTLRHFSSDETTELDRPHLTVFQADAPPWEVDAEQARMSADGSLLLLTGEVLIERAAGDATRPIRMQTREVRVKPREDYAETDEKVRVVSNANRLDAVGMQAWLRPPSRIRFLSQVKGHYVPR
ncbi:MAG: LPS export ABC transporter periplasmic protein LptC [Sedimenticolaceae bacterium]